MRAADALTHFFSGPGTLLLLLGTGVFLSVRCSFPQLRHPRLILRQTLGSLVSPHSHRKEGDFSPFQAACTALGGTVGTGNVAGVAGAIFLGGPGAVFWMWVSAFFGMCTKFAEIALSLRYRETDGQGQAFGGPMVYIEQKLGTPFRPLALLFALCGTLASFGIGNLVQSREIAGALFSLFGMPPLVSGLLLCLLVAALVFGGSQRLGRTLALLVPLMTGLYLLLGLGALLSQFSALPGLLALIVRSAFHPEAAGGAFAGLSLRRCLQLGFSRGLFSNEAGLGSAALAHASSAETEPCREALWGVVEVFVDSFLICTLTALIVLASGLPSLVTLEQLGGEGGAAQAAFQTLLPGAATGKLLSLCLIFFAFTSILSWSRYGALCCRWLFHGKKAAVVIFSLLFSLCCLPGALGSGAFVWSLSASLNSLMSLPNLIALLLLSGELSAMSRRFFRSADVPPRCTAR